MAMSVLSLTSVSSAADTGGTIDIAVGAQRQIASAHALQRVAVGDPSVVDVLIVKGGGGVLLVAKRAGATNVLVWERGSTAPIVYPVVVSTAAAKALLNNATPRVNTYGETTVITGSTTTLQDHQRAVDVANAAASQQLDGATSQTTAGGAPGKGGSRGGNGGSGGSGGNAGGGAGGSHDASIVDASSVLGKNVVQVDVRVVEFSRSVIKEAGLNIFKQSNGFTFGSFAPSGLSSGGITSTSTTGSTTSTVQSLASTTPISSAFNLVVGSASRGIFADLSILEETTSRACSRNRRS